MIFAATLLNSSTASAIQYKPAAFKKAKQKGNYSNIIFVEYKLKKNYHKKKQGK